MVNVTSSRSNDIDTSLWHASWLSAATVDVIAGHHFAFGAFDWLADFVFPALDLKSSLDTLARSTPRVSVFALAVLGWNLPLSSLGHKVADVLISWKLVDLSNLTIVVSDLFTDCCWTADSWSGTDFSVAGLTGQFWAWKFAATSGVLATVGFALELDILSLVLAETVNVVWLDKLFAKSGSLHISTSGGSTFRLNTTAVNVFSSLFSSSWASNGGTSEGILASDLEGIGVTRTLSASFSQLSVLIVTHGNTPLRTGSVLVVLGIDAVVDNLFASLEAAIVIGWLRPS